MKCFGRSWGGVVGAAILLALSGCQDRDDAARESRPASKGAEASKDDTGENQVDGGTGEKVDGTEILVEPSPTPTPTYSPNFVLEVGENELKIATYNVLNLFDTEHDEGKDDYTHLSADHPEKKAGCEKQSSDYYKQQCLDTDWTEDKLQLKLRQIKVALEQQGSLPDVLSVQEIENLNVAQKLAAVLGYPGVLITDSPDERGIDVAIFYRTEKLKLIDHQEIVLQGEEFVKNRTRNVLRAHFQLLNGSPDEVLGVYSNHWPSQSHPATERYLAAKQVQAVIDQQVARIGKEKYHVVLIGDFNTRPEEVPNAFHLVMEHPDWANQLVDVQELSFKEGNPMRKNMPLNSYFYFSAGAWEKLDRILVSKTMLDKQGVELDAKSFRIVAAPALMEPYTNTSKWSVLSGMFLPFVTKGFDPTFKQLSAENQGYSDHLPVVVRVKVQAPAAETRAAGR